MACKECAPAYCAPNRCYCGHSACSAIASYKAREDLNQLEPRVRPVARTQTSWASREEDTWIDKM